MLPCSPQSIPIYSVRKDLLGDNVIVQLLHSLSEIGNRKWAGLRVGILCGSLACRSGSCFLDVHAWSSGNQTDTTANLHLRLNFILDLMEARDLVGWTVFCRPGLGAKPFTTDLFYGWQLPLRCGGASVLVLGRMPHRMEHGTLKHS